jgi:DNA-directed RNA polymerase sigma subunit (sigma70/sigma32)
MEIRGQEYGMREQEKQSLIEEFMEEVPELAEELHDGSLPMEDLIQEGYLGIMNGIAVLAEEEEKGLYGGLGVTETIRGAIRKAMQDALEAEKTLRMDDDRLVVQVELLNKSIDRLTEELGGKQNIDELANDLGISQEEVLKILKLTGTTPDDEAFQAPPQ